MRNALVYEEVINTNLEYQRDRLDRAKRKLESITPYKYDPIYNEWLKEWREALGAHGAVYNIALEAGLAD
jgi:ribosome modulation factor